VLLPVLLSLLSSLVMLGCQPAAQTVVDPQAENQAARAGIEATNQKLSQAVAAGDVEGVRAVYTADAKVLPPNAPEVSGGDAIADWFSSLESAGVEPAVSVSYRREPKVGTRSPFLRFPAV
jgi:hypothetical protein